MINNMVLERLTNEEAQPIASSEAVTRAGIFQTDDLPLCTGDVRSTVIVSLLKASYVNQSFAHITCNALKLTPVLQTPLEVPTSDRKSLQL
jgi:hypothetical protein